MTYRSIFKSFRIVAKPLASAPVRRFSSHSSLVHRAVCPSTESTVNVLKDMNIPEYQIVCQLTDEILSVQNLVVNNNYSKDLNYEYLDDTVEILELILNKYKEKCSRLTHYDHSYPFRHAMIIRHYYETNKKSNRWFKNIVSGDFRSPKNKKKYHNSVQFKNRFRFHNHKKSIFLRKVIKIRA